MSTVIGLNGDYSGFLLLQVVETQQTSFSKKEERAGYTLALTA